MSISLLGSKEPWILDGDGHVREPARLYEEFLPLEYRHLRPHQEITEEGTRWVVGDVKGGWRSNRITLRTTGAEGRSEIPELKGEWDGASRIEDMHTDGISHAVLFPTEGMLYACVEDPPAALALSRAYNDWLGDYCSADPEHLLHVAHLPFAAPRDAADELRRAKETYGSVAAYLRPNPYPPGKFISDPTNEILWDTAEELGIPVCFHEAALLVVPTPGADRFGAEDYLLIHAGAHVVNMMMAMLEIMGTGVLLRHPNLQVGFLEAGCGWVPAWLHRFDEHAEDWAGGERFPVAPSELFRQQCFVTTEGDEVGLALCASMYPDNIIFASDYPHADCVFPGAPDRLLGQEDLSPEIKVRILRDNTARWFGLPVPVVNH